MSDTQYQTKLFTLLFYPEGRIRIESDGWVECGLYSLKQTIELIDRLKEAGWAMVCSVGRKHLQGPIEVMDLYFRREIHLSEKVKA